MRARLGYAILLTMENQRTEKQWWAPVWKGLVMDSEAKHYRAMKNAVWLYVYCLLGANRSFLEAEVPYLESLQVATVEEVLSRSDVVVVANQARAYRDVPARLKPGQSLVDLVHILDGPGPRPRGYIGLSW